MSDALEAIRIGALPTPDLPPNELGIAAGLRAAVNPAINALRWGALGFGLLFAAPEAFRGSYAAVLATAVCLFVTTLRSQLPVQLGSTDLRRSTTPFIDVAVVGAAVGYGGGVESPYFFCLLACIVVVAFGWGAARGGLATVLGILALLATTPTGRAGLDGQVDDQRDLAALMVVVLAVAGAAFVRSRLVEAEQRRTTLDTRVAQLSDTNDLLVLLTRAARTMPGSLTMRDAVAQASAQLRRELDPRTVLLLTWDEQADEWVPRLAEGLVTAAAYRTDELPPPLAATLGRGEPVVVEHRAQAGAPAPLTGDRGSGAYIELVARDRVVGLLGLEHPDADHFDDRSVLLLRGLADVLALSVDNARWFGRLRTLGADEERSRIARELHDRLGQWLTYIALELEQISMRSEHPSPELERLRGDVQSAIDDLRSTLQDLRTGVDAEHPLSERGPVLVARFAQRSGLSATFTTRPPGERVPVPIENELLRILQEALTNVERHADASAVEVTWTMAAGSFELAIRDDGTGFRPEASIRDSAYGLVGMRERADVIGARIRIDSSPGSGTCISVSAGDTDRGVRATGSDRGVRATGSDRGVRATGPDRGVRATGPDRVPDARAVTTTSSGQPPDTDDHTEGRST